MKKILQFYLLCCLSILLMWLATSGGDVGNQDFKFGFHLLIFISLVFYAPLCTIVAYIFYHYKINRSILSNNLFGILYCIFPFLLIWLIKQYCHYVEIEVDNRLDDCSPIVFLIQNLLIVLHWLIINKIYRKI